MGTPLSARHAAIITGCGLSAVIWAPGHHSDWSGPRVEQFKSPWTHQRNSRRGPQEAEEGRADASR